MSDIAYCTDSPQFHTIILLCICDIATENPRYKTPIIKTKNKIKVARDLRDNQVTCSW